MWLFISKRCASVSSAGSSFALRFAARSCCDRSRLRFRRPRGSALPRCGGVGKQIAIGFENGVWLVFHLMIAGRLHWKAAAKVGAEESGCIRVRKRLPVADRSRHATSRGDSHGRRRRRITCALRRRNRTARRDPRGVRRRVAIGQSHAEAGAHRSASLQRHRQRLFG